MTMIVDKSIKKKSRLPRIFLKIKKKTNLDSRKNQIIFISEKYVKGYYVLLRLLISDFLLFKVLFWSSIKVMFLKNNKENYWLHTVTCYTQGGLFDIKQF